MINVKLNCSYLPVRTCHRPTQYRNKFTVGFSVTKELNSIYNQLIIKFIIQLLRLKCAA